jgi:hypothetical protein
MMARSSTVAPLSPVRRNNESLRMSSSFLDMSQNDNNSLVLSPSKELLPVGTREEEMRTEEVCVEQNTCIPDESAESSANTSMEDVSVDKTDVDDASIDAGAVVV